MTVLANQTVNPEHARPTDPATAAADCDILRYAERWLGAGILARRVAFVLESLPARVRGDLLDDPCFHLALDNYQPGRGRSVWLRCPTPESNGSRSIVLKPRLAECDERFAHWVIAHELAHAFLRNRGSAEQPDPEHAADHLAAGWGFPRPH